MKIYLVLLVSLILFHIRCGDKQRSYRGYVYYQEKPLRGVTVTKKNSSQFDSTKTDVAGFFRLDKPPDVIEDLIFKKEGFKTDTVATVWTQHGESVNYFFLNKEFDTIQLRLSSE